MQIRLDKLLAHSGYGSRKEVKSLIRKGFVLVNDEIVYDDDLKIDTNVDEVVFDNEVINFDEYVYILLNKPQGYISATYDDRYTTVLDLVPEYNSRNIFPVGRLDIDTTGLLLLTNDGKLAHKLLSPNNHVEKEYYLTYEGTLDADAIEKFKNGININDEYITKPAILEIYPDNKAKVIITEGKYHQVKRMINAVSGEVTSLKRVRMGNLILDDLAEGEYRVLTKEEIL